MTLHQHQTARLNAQPLARHIDTPEPVTPQFDNLDDAIEAMKADARDIKKRSAGPTRQYTTGLGNEDIVDAIEARPGITSVQLGDLLNQKPGVMYSRLKTLLKWGCIRYRWQPGQTKRVKAFFRVEGVPVAQPDTRKMTGLRAKTIAFIRDNPGCTTRDIARHFGISNGSAGKKVSDAREATGVTIISKRTGTNTPSQHWVKAQEGQP